MVFYNNKLHTMRSRFVFFSLFILASITTTAFASPAYLEQLVSQAQQKQLARHPYWRKLLHYQPDLVGSGVTSLVDSPEFFNAHNGKTDSEAELFATLRVFFKNDVDKRAEEPRVCRFIARYAWLDEQLQFDHNKLPVPQCQRFDTWLQRIKPQSMTLIFPTAYMNNPSSMFGHTLLRIDTKDQTEKTRLLAYSVNFAANTGNDGGVLFAVKGLMGGYPGAFSIAPYYLKVREYNDLENRDIWEYQLNFTTEETRRMLMHLWELRTAYFNYYFFDENCSYHLLALIQTARPGLDLTGAFNWFAIPSDTVKRVIAEQGLVQKVTYRPSRFAELKSSFSHLSDNDIEMVNRLANGEIEPDQLGLTNAPAQTQAELLEISYELLNYRMHKHGDSSKELQNRGQRLLLARSNIDVISSARTVASPDYRPDQGHNSSQSSVTLGESDNDAYLELQYRPAYHDLLDRDQGFLKGAQIKFFDTVLRITEDNLRLERFTAVDIFSLTPRSRLQNSLSWKFNAGAERIHITQDNQPLLARLDGGVGFSWNVFGDSLAYTLLETTLDMSSEFTDKYSLGLGPAVGIVSGWNTQWKTRVAMVAQRYGLGETYTRQQLRFELQRSLGLNSAVRLGIDRQYEFERYWTESRVSWQWYF